MKERPITIVLITPTRKRNPLLFCSISSEPITAAWPEPMPGRNEHNGAEIIAANVALKVCFLGSFICFRGRIFWLGILVLFFRETVRAERPKRPVSNGRRGCSIGRLNVRMPKKPARAKIVKDIKNSSSLNIK